MKKDKHKITTTILSKRVIIETQNKSNLDKQALEQACLQEELNNDLIIALSAKKLITIRKLIESGADVNIRDTNDGSDDNDLCDEVNASERTAQHLAAEYDLGDLIKLLVAKGAYIDPRDASGYTPLHIAAFCGCKNAVEVLLRNNADIEATTFLPDQADKEAETYLARYTPLHCSIIQQKMDITKLLLKAKANIHAKTNLGHTPLYLAIECNSEALSSLLIDNGANIEDPDCLGKDMLDFVIKNSLSNDSDDSLLNGNRETISYLIAHGATISKSFPSELLILFNKQIELLESLEDSGLLNEADLGFLNLYITCFAENISKRKITPEEKTIYKTALSIQNKAKSLINESIEEKFNDQKYIKPTSFLINSYLGLTPICPMLEI